MKFLKKSIVLIVMLIFGCNKESEKLKNGLTKSANKVIEYTIRVKDNSPNDKILDTLLITTKRYGNDEQIIHQKRQTLFDNQEMQIEYVYDSNNRLKQEIVRMPTDSLPLKVNYSYKNSLLFQSSSIFDNESEMFTQKETHFYRKNQTKEKSVMTQIYIDKVTNDTINNSLVNAYYDQNEKNDSTIIINLKKPELKLKTIYKYDGDEAISAQQFNYNDSLISSKSFEYKIDKFNNWIEKKIIENGTLKTLIIREIDYK